MGKRVALNPVVVFTGLLFWGWLWGVAGMVLAIPLLLVAKIWAQHTPALAPWAEFLGPEARAQERAGVAVHVSAARRARDASRA